MREIKFRCFDKYNKKMDDVRKLEFENGFINIIPYRYNDWFSEEEYVLMQYTGLKDKNGKEIYEGDIVNCRVLRLSASHSAWNKETNKEHGRCRVLPMEVYYVEPYEKHFMKFGGIDLRPTTKAKELIKEYEKPIGKETKKQIINWYNIDKDDLIEVIGNIYENPELVEENE